MEECNLTDERVENLFYHFFMLEAYAKELGVSRDDLAKFKKLLIHQIKVIYG